MFEVCPTYASFLSQAGISFAAILSGMILF